MLKSIFRIRFLSAVFLTTLLWGCAGGMHEGSITPDQTSLNQNGEAASSDHAQGPNCASGNCNNMEGGAIGAYSDPSESGGGGPRVHKDDLPNLENP